MTLTAGAPLPVLLDALGRAGWGELDRGASQGIRSTLNALRILLPHGSAVGTVTTNQVADAAGLSSRWTARCLRVLEEAGLIIWTRGQLINGTPVPGIIRVSKRAILDLIHRARRTVDERLRARAAETSARISATLRRHTQLNRPRPAKPDPQQTTLSVRVELRSTLPLQGEESRASVPVAPPPRGTRAAALRAAWRERGI